MNLWHWLARKRMERLHPERRWRLSLEDGLLTLDAPDSARHLLRLAALERVAIETNDIGPWGTDLWWRLFGPDGRVALSFPRGAVGEKPVVDALMALPGFDHMAMLQAMGCTQNRLFLLWRAETALSQGVSS